MKVVAIQSSANRDGLTASLTESALEGAETAGADVQLLHLNEFEVEVCRACGTGWGHHFEQDAELAAYECVIDDDFADLRSRIVDADGLIFATPVYFWDMSESAKVFLDRIRRTHYPIRETSPFVGKPVVSIAAAGGSGNGAADAGRIMENFFSKWMQMKRAATVPVTRQTAQMHRDTIHQTGALLVDMVRKKKG